MTPRSRLIWLAILLTFLLIISGLFLAKEILFSYTPIIQTEKPVLILIPPKASPRQIADAFQADRPTFNLYYPLLLAKYTDQLQKIKAGEYQILPKTTLSEFIEKITKGQLFLHKITFPEGWTFRQILQDLESNPSLTHTLQNQADASIMIQIGHTGEQPEGRFYPDTYLFTRGTKDTQILKAAYHLMQKNLTVEWNDRDLHVPYTDAYQALIVASMIEKETAVPEERPMVAGVILRRLALKMRLQIDAAVLYGIEQIYHRKLTKTDFAIDTPFNTYMRTGLPPTPIASPSRSSIWAALHPASGSALYYVAKGDGTHVFSDTYTAHQTAVDAYQKQRGNHANLPSH